MLTVPMPRPLRLTLMPCRILALAAVAFAAGAGPAWSADPFTTQWVTVSDLQVWVAASPGPNIARFEVVGRFDDGRVLYVATPPDAASGAQTSLLRFNPGSNTWTWRARYPSTITTAFYVDGPYHVRLPDDQWLVLARFSTSGTTWKGWIYDDAGSGTFTAVPDLVTTTSFVTPISATLPTGNVLLLTAQGTGPNHEFNVTTKTWSAAGSSPVTLSPVSLTVRTAARLSNGGSVLWSNVVAGTSNTLFAATRDPLTGTWATALVSSSPAQNAPVSNSSPLIGDRFYFRGSANAIRSYSLTTQTLDLEPAGAVLNPTFGWTELFGLRSLGQDWFAIVDTPFPGNANFGVFTGSVLSRPNGTWFSLPATDDILVGASTSGGDYSVEATQLNDGLLLSGRLNASGVVRTRRLQVTSGNQPLPPRIADEIAPMTLTEGDFISFTYRVIGDIPAGGVTVVVERISGGDGNLIVIRGGSQVVLSNGDVKTVYIAAQPDSDAASDTATVQLRILGASADPNTRTVIVTIPEASVQAPVTTGDVNNDGVVNAIDLDLVVVRFGQ